MVFSVALPVYDVWQRSAAYGWIGRRGCMYAVWIDAAVALYIAGVFVVSRVVMRLALRKR